jgi:hypothetical protein
MGFAKKPDNDFNGGKSLKNKIVGLSMMSNPFWLKVKVRIPVNANAIKAVTTHHAVAGVANQPKLAGFSFGTQCFG